MSLTTWTPAAIASKATAFSQRMGRLALKSSQSSIYKITDTDDEAALVVRAITSQRANSINTFGELHPLMREPFTAKAYPGGSRFRGQFDPGVFYCADRFETAAAERGYHHHLFVKNSPELESSGATAFTFFTVELSMELVDVGLAPFSKEAQIFHDKNSYAQSQRFASLVRQSGVPGIKYTSVRNPDKAFCVAMLSPEGFAATQPSSWDESWFCIADGKGARWFNNSSLGAPAPMSFIYE